MAGINFHINLSAGGRCFHTCLDGIFQQIGKHKAQINLIYGKISRQGNQCMKRNVFSFCNGGIISENTVNSLIFTEMQVIVRDFAGCSREIFFNFFYVTLFCQSGQTDKMMADIDVPALLLQWPCRDSRIFPVEGKENGSPAEVWHFCSG